MSTDSMWICEEPVDFQLSKTVKIMLARPLVLILYPKRFKDLSSIFGYFYLGHFNTSST